eukprot:308957_1
MTENKQDTNTDNDTNEQKQNEQKENEQKELHLIYPIPIIKPPPQSLFNDENKNTETKTDNSDNNNDQNNGFIMSSIIKKPLYYCDITSANITWAKTFLQSFCEYLKIPKTQVIEQIMGYLYFIENEWIDPEPFFETLGWDVKAKTNNRKDLLRIPLLLLQFAISNNGYYDSRLRSLLKTILTYCNISWYNEFIIREYSFGVILHVLLQKKEAKSSTKNYGRWAKIGAVGVIGGVLIAVTGGLAAPAVAAGLGAIGLTATGTFLLTTAGTTTLYLLFGVTGAGYTGLKMHNTISEINDFKFISLSEKNQNGLNVIITISGWLESEDDEQSEENKDENDKDKDMESEDNELNVEYWRDILISSGNNNILSDCYTLQFEKECLLELGEGLKQFVAKRAVSGTVKTAATASLGFTAFATLVAALTWPVAILSVAHYIDNPWSVAFAKSKEAGLVLADCLASGNHGRRPVTLIGYSLGARVIFYALRELVNRCNNKDNDEEEKKEDNNDNDNDEDMSKFGRFMKKRKDKKKQKEKEKQKEMAIDLSSIIENVIILGGPCTCDSDEWSEIRKIVSDRIINCYSVNDWVLKFVYRTAAATTSVAGLMPIQCDGIENVNLSQVIDGHSEYYNKTPKIIKYLVDSCGVYL